MRRATAARRHRCAHFPNKTAGQAMTKQPKPSQPKHGKGPSPHEGTKQHGWSPDVDETRQQENPSAHRSFHRTNTPRTRAPDVRSPRKKPGTPTASRLRATAHEAKIRARAPGRRACTTWAPAVGPSGPAERRTRRPRRAWTPRIRPASAAPGSAARHEPASVPCTVKPYSPLVLRSRCRRHEAASVSPPSPIVAYARRTCSWPYETS